jgi:hypothetical protein
MRLPFLFHGHAENDLEVIGVNDTRERQKKAIALSQNPHRILNSEDKINIGDRRKEEENQPLFLLAPP